MTFEPGKEYKTRDGCRARVYAVDGGGAWPIHGAVEHAGGAWISRAWDATGCYTDGGGSGCGLMPPEPEKITLKIAIYQMDEHGGPFFATSYEGGLRSGGGELVAIIPITFHRGEGLE